MWGLLFLDKFSSTGYEHVGTTESKPKKGFTDATKGLAHKSLAGFID